MSRDEFLGLLRQLITFVGAIAVSHGTLQQSDLEALLGILLAVASALWMIWAKRQAATEHAAAVQAALYTTPPKDPELEQFEVQR